MTILEPSNLLGSRLIGVHYDLLNWEDVPTEASDVDQVSKAVNLHFDTMKVLIRWDLRPPIERLVLCNEEGPGPLTQRVDVSGRWAVFIGSRLVHTSWAEQETMDGFQRWAVTFTFDPAGKLVVALGELVNGTPSYLPDSLLVTASRDVGLSYRPLTAPTPAWIPSGATDD